MSNKLNAEELAAKRNPDIMVRRKQADGTYKEVWRGRGRDRTTYAKAIREVAQPIADQRDELMEAAMDAVSAYEDGDLDGAIIGRIRAAIAKATQP